MRTAIWRNAAPVFIARPTRGRRRPFSPVERPGRSQQARLERSIRRRTSPRYPGSAPDARKPYALVSPLTSRPIERKTARPRRQRAPSGVGQAYARDMRNGHWLFTGDAIRFTTKPELIDGQHRLQAIIEADVMLQIVCVFGLEPKAKHALDMGRKRSAGDVLALKGYAQSTRLSGAARQLLYIKYNSPSAKVTNAEIEEIVDRHPKLADVTHHFDNTRDISPALLTALRIQPGGLRPPRLSFKAGIPV